jgi:hypothetical protein
MISGPGVEMTAPLQPLPIGSEANVKQLLLCKLQSRQGRPLTQEKGVNAGFVTEREGRSWTAAPFEGRRPHIAVNLYRLKATELDVAITIPPKAG